MIIALPDKTRDRRRASVAHYSVQRLLAIAGIGLMLGACSKCDVPTPWQHSSAGGAPAACHDGPQAQ
jgi:hypothetical protein